MLRAVPVLAFLASAALATPALAAEPPLPTPAPAVRLIENVNASLQAAGSPLRLNEVWFFTSGRGIAPYRRLRTGSRWPQSTVPYILDASDYTQDIAASAVDAALVRAYDSWNAVPRTTISAVRVPDSGANFDVLDGMILDAAGNCVSNIDLTSPNLIFDPATGGLSIQPEAPIVVGGWLDAAYFDKCMGSSAIIGVTFSLSLPDSNHDGYPDLAYVEQFYNQQFKWTTTDSAYLNFSAPFDIESIAVHEDGHALGLGHFGGPNANEPFKVQPNGKVYDPEAVMNPAYLGGEKRSPLPTDEAALRSLYGRQN
jgi:hypothetical protein